MGKKYYIIILILFTVLDIFGQQHENTITINETNQAELIGNQVFYFIDKNSDLKISDILKTENQNKFSKEEKNVFTAPASNSAYWFKFTVKNYSGQNIWLELIGSYSFWYIDFYSADSTGKYSIPVESGALRHKKNNEFHSKFYSFKLANDKDTIEKTFYLKIKSGVSPDFPFYVGTIKGLDKTNGNILLFTYLFLGMMIIMFLYNLFLFFATKDKIYLSYIFFVFANIFCYTFNNNFSLVGDNFWWWNNHIAWQFIGDLSSTIFILHFLNLRKTFPLSFKVYIVLISIDFGIALANLFGIKTVYLIDYYMLVSMGLIINSIFTGVYLIIKRNKNAKFFLLSWSLLLISIVVFMLVINGFLPYNSFTRYSVYIGISAEALLFSMALANRLNIMRKEKEDILRENLILHQKHNIILEKEVELKTKELLKENKIKDALISEIHHRVKNNLQTISSLIYFQLKYITKEENKADLKDIQMRLNSIAAIHEMLYNKNDLTQISLKTFIEDLATFLKTMTTAKNQKINIVCNVDKIIIIKISQAISLGMLISEITSNSIKYAFAEENNPQIDINIYKKADKIYFKIKDNGCGADIDKIKNTKNSLGIKLIKLFALELIADMKVKNNNGLEYKFVFSNLNSI